MIGWEREAKTMSRHLHALNRAVAVRIVDLTKNGKYTPDSKSELRHLYYVLRPVLDNVAKDWNELLTQMQQE